MKPAITMRQRAFGHFLFHGPRRRAGGLIATALALTLAWTGAAVAEDFRMGSIVIQNPWSRATPGGAQVAGGYLTIRNTGSQPDRLVSATVEISDRTEIHEMAVTNGVMTMRQLPNGLSAPAHADVSLAPGSYHLMFLGLKRRPLSGETFRGTLTFERAGAIAVTLQSMRWARPVGAAAARVDIEMAIPRRKLMLAAAASTVALLAAPIAGYVMRPSESPSAPASSASVGGPFRLTTMKGTTLSDAELRGQPFAIFFGFTFCPEVCPTTLWELSDAMKELGTDADRFKVLFVSLDPARDTPEQLATYLQSFDPRIVGLTGSDADIATVARAYRVYWRKVQTEGQDYTLDHTAAVYLMDRNGAFAGVLGYGEDRDVRVRKLRSLARGEEPR